MPAQSTSPATGTSTPSSSPEIAALVSRLQACETGLVDVVRGLRYGLDDLGAALEEQRQIRRQLVGLLTRDGAR